MEEIAGDQQPRIPSSSFGMLQTNAVERSKADSPIFCHGKLPSIDYSKGASPDDVLHCPAAERRNAASVLRAEDDGFAFCC